MKTITAMQVSLLALVLGGCGLGGAQRAGQASVVPVHDGSSAGPAPAPDALKTFEIPRADFDDSVSGDGAAMTLCSTLPGQPRHGDADKLLSAVKHAHAGVWSDAAAGDTKLDFQIKEWKLIGFHATCGADGRAVLAANGAVVKGDVLVMTSDQSPVKLLTLSGDVKFENFFVLDTKSGDAMFLQVLGVQNASQAGAGAKSDADASGTIATGNVKAYLPSSVARVTARRQGMMGNWFEAFAVEGEGSDPKGTWLWAQDHAPALKVGKFTVK